MRVLVNITLRDQVCFNQTIDWNYPVLPQIGHEIADITIFFSKILMNDLKQRNIQEILPKKRERDNFTGNALEYFAKVDSFYYGVDNIVWCNELSPMPELFISQIVR